VGSIRYPSYTVVCAIPYTTYIIMCRILHILLYVIVQYPTCTIECAVSFYTIVCAISYLCTSAGIVCAVQYRYRYTLHIYTTGIVCRLSILHINCACAVSYRGILFCLQYPTGVYYFVCSILHGYLYYFVCSILHIQLCVQYPTPSLWSLVQPIHPW